MAFSNATKFHFWGVFYGVFGGPGSDFGVKIQIWPHLLGPRAKFLPNFGKFWNFQMRPNFNFEVCFMRFLGVLVQIFGSNLKFGHWKAIFGPIFFWIFTKILKFFSVKIFFAKIWLILYINTFYFLHWKIKKIHKNAVLPPRNEKILAPLDSGDQVCMKKCPLWSGGFRLQFGDKMTPCDWWYTKHIQTMYVCFVCMLYSLNNQIVT